MEVMLNEQETRAEKLGKYFIESKKTIREIAVIYGISKSTVHNDLSKKLQKINPPLYAQVRIILDEHLSVRHIRGGMATKRKYLLIKK